MLKQLYIRNYALFAETQVTFPAGLNILTGETGAGKSLLVGALGLIQGKRVDNSVIFIEEEKCIVEAQFAQLSPVIRQQLEAFEDFDLEDPLIIRREIRPNGKSRAFINDTPVTLDVLRQVSTLLFDLHSQHENQSLLSHERQLELLDAFAGTTVQAMAFGEQLKAADKLLREIRTLEKREQSAKQQLDYLRHQLEELEAAGLKADEEQELEDELHLLQHVEEFREALGAATEVLYDQDLSVFTQVSEILEPLAKLSGVNSSIAEEVERLRDVQQSIKESATAFRNLLDSAESDPERLAFIEERLAIYHRLKLKYGLKSGQELLERYHQVQSDLEDVDSLEGQIAALKREHTQQMAALAKAGLTLEQARIKAKGKLEGQISALLLQVGFEKARFEVAVERQPDASSQLRLGEDCFRAFPNGLNRVFFLIQPNPGMPAGPLSQIASGGEISRVMLAIKAALAEQSDFPVMIFDEIDTGISGEIAKKVGKVMRQLSEKFQILSITHLPQIAARGQQHFQIEKRVEGQVTTSQVRQLSHDERVQELAKMLSGAQPTESAVRNALELIGE